MPPITIDGSLGEGGGQILRTILAMSIVIGRPFRLFNIRAARNNPGLQPQHLAAVNAATVISHARVQGNEKDSQELLFEPSTATPGDYFFSVGTAGSTSLVLQTLLPALMLANEPSSLIIEGGTHNPLAPPFDFLEYAFLPLLNRMGPTISATLERPGFAPKGGGRLHVVIQPSTCLKPLNLTERGQLLSQYAMVWLSHLPEHIAKRELAVIQRSLDYDDGQLKFSPVVNAYGPGNMVSIIVESENITECFTAFGQRGLPAEQVAENAVNQVKRYLAAGVPVGPFLADQLLLPLAIAGNGSFVTVNPSSHMLTNREVIRAFMGVDIQINELRRDVWNISL